MNSTNPRPYCPSTTQYLRRMAREVFIGDVPMGGKHPIRVQSMTTTDTMDTEKTVAQSIRMIEAGCEYVRITAPSINEAKNLENIKNELRKRGYNTPLIADIHFTPNAAEMAARIVEKVRVNPGNYVDKKKFEILEYTDAEYEAELERIRKRFSPLVLICKEYGTAMRIGTNHGSLSDRIMNSYGDTPEGMVESALEFLRICEDLNYKNIVLSMKASNPLVMIQAYRLLVAEMDKFGMDYPLHLGVTEAGEDEEGRVKSAMGIGTLLEDGLGDTVRVSLTEDPEFEAPVAISLIERYNHRAGHPPIKMVGDGKANVYSPYAYKRRESFEVENLGGHNVPRIISDFSGMKDINELTLKAVDYHFDAVTDKWNMGEQGADYLYFGETEPAFMLPNGTKGIYDYQKWVGLKDKTNNHPLLNVKTFLGDGEKSATLNFVLANAEEVSEIIKAIKANPEEKAALVLTTDNPDTMPQLRQMFVDLTAAGIKNPVLIKLNYSNLDEEKFILHCGTDAGGLLADGFGDGLFLTYQANENSPSIEDIKFINRTGFNILQAARTRISKTEYISCPSCGRTLFDLQETTAMIRKKTDHLKGVKIAIMGCIVNGPGEMADADYGYVGTGVGKITLYRGKDIVKRNIDSTFALDELINLINEDGNWIEKKELMPSV
ncbi:MAG: (E)-4-hydroxy-3-methylbut-2-enyl-diphosphate synthase [Bacteroidetes bacterium]|nr:(E)-4-hydroxy-3-methylbut-2-enyl-diphosphate synthase [Bacteroidota bacterium]